jgi:hypothetical protein
MEWIASTHAAIITSYAVMRVQAEAATPFQSIAYFFFKSEVVLKTPFRVCRREKTKEIASSDGIISEHSARKMHSALFPRRFHAHWCQPTSNLHRTRATNKTTHKNTSASSLRIDRKLHKRSLVTNGQRTPPSSPQRREILQHMSESEF